jgi:arabinose-5-phosphate isomerase
MKHTGENVVRIEAEALRALADRLAGPMAADFERAVDLMFHCQGRIVVSGMGKSGLIARKIAATLSSTGSPALYLHPVEALHGDLGMIVRGDVVLVLSASGETEEILQLLATIKRLQVPLITMTCDEIAAAGADKSVRATQSQAGEGPFDSRSGQVRATRASTLAAAAEVALDCSISKEACSLGLAPTASTTTMLALGDALAVALSEKRGFKEEDFANLHPGGKLGKRLARVESLMHSGDAVPRVTAHAKMPDVIYEMSRKKLGVTTVVEGDRLLGVISDGDLRRLLQQRGKDTLDLTAQECMTRTPKTINPQEFAATALARYSSTKMFFFALQAATRKDGRGRPSHLFQHLRPDGDADFAQVGFAQQEHQRARLADAAADGERDLIIDNGLVIGELEIVEEIGHLQLFAQGFGVDADAHGTEFVAALGDVVPDQDVAVQSVSVAMSLLAGVGDPVVVVGGAIFMREAVFQWPADADNKDGRIFLQDDGLAALAGQVGIHGEKFFGVKECEFLGQAGIARGAQLGEHFQCEFIGADQNLPDLLHDGLEKFEVALFRRDDALPVPLIDVGGVVVVEEIIFAHGAHVGADAFTGAACELLERDSLPFGGGLHNLRVDGVFVTIVGDVELNGSAGTVAIEHVVDAAFCVDDQRDLHHHQA